MNEPARETLTSLLALEVAFLIATSLPLSARGVYDPKHGHWLQRPKGLSG